MSNFDINEIPSAWKGHEQFASWLVQTMRPKVTMELGADYGFSAICLGISNPGDVFTVDAFEGDPHTGFRNSEAQCRDNIARSGLQNVFVIKGRFCDVAKDWNTEIDILHIDGAHGYEDVKRDFETWLPHVRRGGVILLHDTQSFPNDVGRFFREIAFPKFEFPHSAGLGVVVKL